MTEQERPRTDRMRAVLAEVGLDAVFDVELEAARTEGRQQAVRDAKAEIQKAYPREIGRELNAILDRVAGLNASESPPPTPSEQAAYEQGLEDGRLVEQAARRMVGNASESPATVDEVVYEEGGEQVVIRRLADTSESPPVEDIAGDLWHQREGWHSLGDASESGQPRGTAMSEPEAEVAFKRAYPIGNSGTERSAFMRGWQARGIATLRARRAVQDDGLHLERLAKALEDVFLLNLDPTGLTPEWWKERAREVVIVIRDE